MLASLGEVVSETDDGSDLILYRCDYEGFEIHILPHIPELPVELVQCDGHLRSGLLQVVLDLLLRGEGVDHVRHGTYHVDCIEHADRLGAVG